MSTTPAVITIFDEIEARADNITLTNGYSSDVREIERSKLAPFEGGDWPKLSFWPTDKQTVEDDYGEEQHTLRIVVGYFNLTMDEHFADVAARLESDVITAMNRATSAPAVSDDESYNLGGLVEELNATRTEYINQDAQAPWCGALVEFTIKYRSAMADAFSIGV